MEPMSILSYPCLHYLCAVRGQAIPQKNEFLATQVLLEFVEIADAPMFIHGFLLHGEYKSRIVSSSGTEQRSDGGAMLPTTR